MLVAMAMANPYPKSSDELKELFIKRVITIKTKQLEAFKNGASTDSKDMQEIAKRQAELKEITSNKAIPIVFNRLFNTMVELYNWITMESQGQYCPYVRTFATELNNFDEDTQKVTIEFLKLIKKGGLTGASNSPSDSSSDEEVEVSNDVVNYSPAFDYQKQTKTISEKIRKEEEQRNKAKAEAEAKAKAKAEAKRRYDDVFVATPIIELEKVNAKVKQKTRNSAYC